MMKALILLLFCCLPGFVQTGLDKAEAQKAFTLLNKIRSNPAAFTQEMPFLAEIGPKPLLKWNDTLANVAEAKALDMATRNYVDHVDPDGYGLNHFINKAGYALSAKWLTAKNLNFFESISAGSPNGEAAIRKLIIDNGVPTLGHRKHLLGLDSWTSTLYDVGIGYARPVAKAEYKSYVCVIIAKHK
jgi:uncharacterized protein YkwD